MAKGWMDQGIKTFSALDRLWAARRLYLSYVKSRENNLSSPDLARPKVDGGVKTDMSFGRLNAIEEFITAFKSIPFEARGLVEAIVLEEREVEIKNKKKTRDLKRIFSKALDCLILFYMQKK